MKLILASRNKKKMAEVEELLGGSDACKIEISSLHDIGYMGDIIEDGRSFAENAVIKASVPAAMGYAGIADDSGLCVDALEGAPGIYSARFAGNDATDDKNNEKLLQKLINVPEERRSGYFVCVMAYACPKQMMPEDLREALIGQGAVFHDAFASVKAGTPVAAFTVEGRCNGHVLTAPAGNGGFGYDPLFYIERYKKTFAQLSPDEKNAISHRGAAMNVFKSMLQTIQNWENKNAYK